MIDEKKIEDNRDFLDAVAIEVMKAYISRQPPQSWGNSMSVARVAYRQALAMLEIREQSVEELAKEGKLIRKKRER